MDPDAYSAVLVIASLTATALFSYAFIRLFHRWLKGSSFRESQPSAQLHDSTAIAQLQSSVDAIAIEVERISEAQRFTTRLMNERMIADPERLTAGQRESAAR
jgi:hypothetical protein